MPVTLTKKELNKLLVDERAKSRVKNQQSKFMSRTLSAYNSQKKRLDEERAEHPEYPKSIPYTLAELRQLAHDALQNGKCPYSGERLTVINMAIDHGDPVARGGSWGIENLVVCRKSNNQQKGNMTVLEYTRLMRGARKVLAPVAFAQFIRRLTAGGKFY